MGLQPFHCSQQLLCNARSFVVGVEVSLVQRQCSGPQLDAFYSPTTSAAGPETSDIHLEYYLSIIHSHAKETASISEETRRIIARRKELEAGIRATPIQAPYAVRKAAHQMVERKRKEVAKNAAESARAEYAEAKLAYQIKAAEATRSKL